MPNARVSMDSKETPIKLHIPTPTLAKLSFCPTNMDGINQWLKTLPMANTGEAARQLYMAIREVNQLKTEPVLRFKLLEAIRPFIYSVCGVLNKHFLNSSVSLNEKQLKIANLSQALQTHLATGYKLVIAYNIANLPATEKPSKVVTISIHRAITDIGHVVLRALQLYCRPPEHSWLEINQLYLLAEMHKLQTYRVSDDQTRYISTSCIADIFIRVHLIGTAKPSNLRQQDIVQLYDATELWAARVKITDADDDDAMFLINLHRDKPALYRQHLRDIQKPLFRSLNTRELVDELGAYAANPQGGSNVTVPGKLNDNLLAHATQSWGIHWQRSFRRTSSQGNLDICIGMSSTHYYISGRKEFERFLIELKPNSSFEGEEASKTKAPTDDVWSDAFDADGGGARVEADTINFDAVQFINKHKQDEKDHQGELDSKFPIYDVSLINTSPGGYCIQWNGHIPAGIQAGEILGIKEAKVNHWSIGVIRWIRHLRQDGTQLGIELLAPKAEAGATRLLQKTGENGPFLRSLLLPEIKAMAQPASLLLPRMPFRIGNKVDVLHPSVTGRQQLVKRITSTNSFSQFQFRQNEIRPKHNTLPQTADIKDDDFDSLWNKL